ncbi:MAG: hypothetical protein LLF76_00190 [Planctomycetaceae bacterium]|nr:hypothetical protein [Planctomycetaceae bacterium]
MGLNICYTIIVNDHHGRILVDSALGEGTTFTILLPENGESLFEADKPDEAVCADLINSV